jgi:hypothetical protein
MAAEDREEGGTTPEPLDQVIGTSRQGPVIDPSDTVAGIPSHYKRDMGLGTTDVAQSPYAGSADERALDMADEDVAENTAVGGSDIVPD